MKESIHPSHFHVVRCVVSIIVSKVNSDLRGLHNLQLPYGTYKNSEVKKVDNGANNLRIFLQLYIFAVWIFCKYDKSYNS